MKAAVQIIQGLTQENMKRIRAQVVLVWNTNDQVYLKEGTRNRSRHPENCCGCDDES